jgi:hypothetical protein
MRFIKHWLEENDVIEIIFKFKKDRTSKGSCLAIIEKCISGTARNSIKVKVFVTVNGKCVTVRQTYTEKDDIFIIDQEPKALTTQRMMQRFENEKDKIIATNGFLDYIKQHSLGYKNGKIVHK